MKEQGQQRRAKDSIPGREEVGYAEDSFSREALQNRSSG